MSTTRIRCYTLGIIMLLTPILIGQVGISLAASPLEDLKIPIETVLSLLKDPVYKNPDQRQQQRDKILVITRKLFDFTEMSKRALARNWKSFSSWLKPKFSVKPKIFQWITACILLIISGEYMMSTSKVSV